MAAKNTTKVQNGLSEKVLSHGIRMSIIRRQREFQGRLGGLFSGHGRGVHVQHLNLNFESLECEGFSFPAQYEQSAPAIPYGLKPISIREMTEEESVFQGYFLEGLLVEDPFFMKSIHAVIEDKNGYVERLCVYGLDNTEEDMKRLCYGTKIRILNPYFRFAIDGRTAIRVEDPKSIQFLETKTDLCRYCRKGNAVLRCARCHSNSAKYCNKECQARDWTLLKHKLVCFKH